MPRDDIVSFLSHIKARELKHGATHAFRFKAFEKSGQLTPTSYPGDNAPHTTKGKRRSKAKSAAAAHQGTSAAPHQSKDNVGKPPVLPPTLPPARSYPSAHLPVTPTHGSFLTTATTPTPTTPTTAISTPAPAGAAQHPPLPLTPDTTAPYTSALISQEQMTQLMSMGHPPGMPVNGPADGPPKYGVPFESAAKLDIPIDPALLAAEVEDVSTKRKLRPRPRHQP